MTVTPKMKPLTSYRWNICDVTQTMLLRIGSRYPNFFQPVGPDRPRNSVALNIEKECRDMRAAMFEELSATAITSHTRLQMGKRLYKINKNPSREADYSTILRLCKAGFLHKELETLEETGERYKQRAFFILSDEGWLHMRFSHFYIEKYGAAEPDTGIPTTAPPGVLNLLRRRN